MITLAAALLTLFASAFLATLAFYAHHVWNAPEGYEDERGYHEGEEPKP